MLRALIASFSFSFLLLLTACGGDGGAASSSASGSASSTIGSVAVKGVIQNGVVKLLRWQSGAYTVVATAGTQSDGSFSFPGFTPVPGEVLKLSLSASTGARMICDASSCGSAAFGDAVDVGGDLALTSWVSVGSDGVVTVMPITPVSTLLVDYAEVLGGGHLKASVLKAARSHVAAVFQLTPEELLATPGNIASAPWISAASAAQRKITLLAAAFAQLAGGDTAQMQSIIKDYSQSFIDNNGALMEADPAAGASLAQLFGAVNTSVALISSEAVRNLATSWVDGITAALVSGKLSNECSGLACEDFSSQRFVDALGPLGEDLTQVLSAEPNNYSSLEAALAGEIKKFGWLASADSIALAQAAVQTIAYSGEAMMSRMLTEFILQVPGLPDEFRALLNAPVNLDSIGGLSATVVGNVLTVSGQQTGDHGLAVNLEVTLPELLSAMSGNKQFAFGLKGTVSNDKVQGDVDATLLIDASETDFSDLVAALNASKAALAALNDQDESNDGAAQEALTGVMDAMADLAKSARFSVAINAQKFRFAQKIDGELSGSMLAIEGSGSVDVNMDGGIFKNHRIVLAGVVDGGKITLPNGSWFQVAEGDHLAFTMDADGSFDAKFSTSVLALFTGEANGKLKNMGVTISNLRDSIVSQIKAQAFDLGGMLGQLLTDVSGMDLTIAADMRLVELNHLYKLRIHNTELSISQPDSDATAMTAELSMHGLLIGAGEAWWLFAPDFRDLAHPAVVISDDTGGAWRYSFDLSGLLVGSPGNCYGAALFC